MTSVSFTVPGEPRGKGRPRFAKGRAYTDAATASYENLITMAASAAIGPLERFAGPVAVHVQVALQPPRSGSRKRLAAMLAGELRPIKRPDVENVAKAVLDAMNQVVYRDDAQVVRLVVDKHWSNEPGLTVTVSEVLP